MYDIILLLKGKTRLGEVMDLTDMKIVIAKNIAELRKKQGMTQLDLAEKLNYSDKAVSKWERGESLPDITVIKNIADLFGVTVDYLINEAHELPEAEPEPVEVVPSRKRISFRTSAAVTGMSLLLVWLIATCLFFALWYGLSDSRIACLPFVYALPITALVWLVLNSIWFNRRRNYLIISLLMWLSLTALWFTLLPIQNLWLIFLLGIPGEAIILVWSRMKFPIKLMHPYNNKNKGDQ